MELKKGYKRTDIGLIPKDWEINKIGNFTTSYAGGTPSTKEPNYWGGDIKWMNSGELNNKFIFDVKNRITVEGVNNSSTKLIPEKCVLIGLAGQGKTRGTAAINYTKLCTNQSIASIYPSSNHNSKFLYYYIDNLYDELRSLSTGDGGRGGLNLTIIRNLNIPLPTIEEQETIAQVLSDTDQLIQNLKNLIAKKKAIKQGAMQELLTGKKRLQGFTEEWETKKLGEVAKIIMGQSPLSEFYNYEGVGLPLIQGNADIKNRKTIIRTYTSFYSKQAEKGDMIMTVRAPVGEIAKASFNCSVGRGVCAIKYSNDYLFYYLMFKENCWSQFSTGSTFDSINSNQLKSFEIKLPRDIQEQQAIAQILSDMDAEIEVLEQQLQKTQALKQGMMQELLTGKTRLVKPATQEEPKPLAMVAEPEVVYKKETKPKKHNEHINDAVLIGTMANAFGSEQFPLTRFRYTKVSYLLKRYKEEQDAGYLKKTAGPYKPKTRYGGAEKIAMQNQYVKKHISNHKGKKYENFLAGDNVTEAINYFKDWYGEKALQWIQQFKYTKRNQLELWATVDMAIEDLKQENKPVNFQTIKELINNHEEWRPKLKRPVFSDENIKIAINKIYQLFG